MLRNTGVLICFLSFLPVASTAECFQWSYFNLDKTDATFKSGEQWKDKFIDYTIFSHMKRDDGWVMLPQQTTPFEFNNRQYEIVGGDFLDLTVRPQCPLRKFIPELECRLPWDELLNYNQRSKREEEELQRPKRAIAAAFLASSSASDSANARRQEEEKKRKKRIDFLRLLNCSHHDAGFGTESFYHWHTKGSHSRVRLSPERYDLPTGQRRCKSSGDVQGLKIVAEPVVVE
ncbi:hypothetical protein M3Y96_01003300 [Aphelenchoides besseyi]|nr:hypothetical protein M3Y96_01003300 [Aphelenchoides besseyi]